MGFIDKYITPKKVDFVAALRRQAEMSRKMLAAVLEACEADDRGLLERVDELHSEGGELKSENMEELLDVFIAPYDKESLYRMITQLDWISLSITHFKLEVVEYEFAPLEPYLGLLGVLEEMVGLLDDGLVVLTRQDPKEIAALNRRIHTSYDHVVTLCAQASAAVLERDDLRLILAQRDLLKQLREVAKRIHVSANTLEDMAIKIV